MLTRDAEPAAATTTTTTTAARPSYGVFAVRVARIRTLTPHFVRITFTGDEVEHFGATGLDQRVKVVLPVEGLGYASFPTEGDWFAGWRMLPDAERNVIRTYTARAVRPELAEFDIDFVAHGDGGPASRWALGSRVGDELLVVGPDSRSSVYGGGIDWRPGTVRSLLIAGDETAAPAICSILESLPADASGTALIEVPTAADALEVQHPAGVTVRWLPRDASESGYGEQLICAVHEWAADRASRAAASQELQGIDEDAEMLWDVPDGQSADGELYAWLAGEASAIKTIRRYLVSELGIDRRSVAFMGYWRLGRSEN